MKTEAKQHKAFCLQELKNTLKTFKQQKLIDKFEAESNTWEKIVSGIQEKTFSSIFAIPFLKNNKVLPGLVKVYWNDGTTQLINVCKTLSEVNKK